MSLDPGTFKTLIPSRFIAFTIPNPTINPNALLLRIAVLDSPIHTTSTTNTPLIAAMLVPNHRESDWTFSTEAGHLQLLLNFPQFSRLVLIGNSPLSPHPTTYIRSLTSNLAHPEKNLEEQLTPLLMALYPKSAFANGLPKEPTFLTYEDDVICSVVVEICVGDLVGEFLVEDVEVEIYDKFNNCIREFRRRLRFKRMPNLIQTQVRILPISSKDKCDFLDLEGLRGKEEMDFHVDSGLLVQPYLTPMVAGLSLIASYLDGQIHCGITPKALCLGVGGGALLSFLNKHLGFDVVGVEADEVVLRVARQYFGLNDGEFVRVIVGDGIELIEKVARQGTKRSAGFSVNNNEVNGLNLVNMGEFDAKFDVIMVDLDSGDAKLGVSAPPLEFVRKSVFQAARFVINESGILVVNVIPPGQSVYKTLLQEIREVFEELYEIDVGNGENFVLIATASPVSAAPDDVENSFLTKLKSVISGAYMDSIMKT